MPLSIEWDIDGAAELSAKLQTFAAESRRLPRAFRDIKNRVHRQAHAGAPVYRGATQRSLKSRSSNMKADIWAGSFEKKSHGGGVYVRLNHQGVRWRGQRPNKWLTKAALANRDFARTRLERELNTKIKEIGL